MSQKSIKRWKRLFREQYKFNYLDFLEMAKKLKFWKERLPIAWSFLRAADPYKGMTPHEKKMAKKGQ